MRKIIFQNLTSLDGYYEGPNREIDWHNVDAEFNDFAISFLNTVDTLLFGRVTYELMASYWPTPGALKNDPVVAERMNNISKIVFSKTMKKADWNNTRLVSGLISAEIVKLKQQPGKDLLDERAGLRKRQSFGVQRVARQAVEARQQLGRDAAIARLHEVALARAVKLVAHQRVADRREVNANLVLAPGLG